MTDTNTNTESNTNNIDKSSNLKIVESDLKIENSIIF